MAVWADYPRMMFHRTKPPVTIKSRDEENALGAEWSRTLWPAEPMAKPEPARDELDDDTGDFPAYQKLMREREASKPRNDEVSAFEPAPKHHAKPRARPPAPHQDKPKTARKK